MRREGEGGTEGGRERKKCEVRKGEKREVGEGRGGKGRRLI